MHACSMEDCDKDMNKIRGSSKTRGSNRTSKTLSKNDKSSHPCFVHNFNRNTFSVSLFIKTLDIV